MNLVPEKEEKLTTVSVVMMPPTESSNPEDVYVNQDILNSTKNLARPLKNS